MKTKNRHGGKDFAFLCFRTKQEKDEAMAVLNGYMWKGRCN